MRTFAHLSHAVLIAALALLLTGCGGAIAIRGRVIEGAVGQAMIVGPEDERLSERGIPGIDVTVLTEGGSEARGRGVVGKATTDEEGNFEFSIPSGKHPASSVTVRVIGDTVFSSRSRTYLPTNAQRLLCTVILREPDQTETPSTE